MYKLLVASIAFALSMNNCLASEGEDQAAAFASLYTSLCFKNLMNLEGLREKLRPVPALTPEMAAHFLAGNQGDAWPVPDKRGTFVLALPRGKKFCALYARRADTDEAIKLFDALVTHPPAPLIVKKLSDTQKQTPTNGLTRTVSYEWSIQNATRKLMFTLTTAPYESAQIQVLGSAAIISE